MIGARRGVRGNKGNKGGPAVTTGTWFARDFCRTTADVSSGEPLGNDSPVVKPTLNRPHGGAVAAAAPITPADEAAADRADKSRV